MFTTGEILWIVSGFVFLALSVIGFLKLMQRADARDAAKQAVEDERQAAAERLAKIFTRARRLMEDQQLAAAPAWFPMNLRESWDCDLQVGREAAMRLLAQQDYPEQSQDDRTVLGTLANLEGMLPMLARRQAMFALSEMVATCRQILDTGLRAVEKGGFLAAAAERRNFDSAIGQVYQALATAENTDTPDLEHFLAVLGPMIDAKGAAMRLCYEMAATEVNCHPQSGPSVAGNQLLS